MGPLRRSAGRGGSTRRRGARAGSVLAETLVAFAILAVGLGLIVTGLAVALRSDGHTAATRAALRTAQGLLARAGVTGPLAAADRDGEDAGGARWRLSVARVTPEPLGARDGRTPPPLAAFWVEVTVAMPDGARASLAGLKLAPAP